MRHNKKGVAGIVGGVILSVIAVLLIANLLIPQAKTMTETTEESTLLDEHTIGTNTTSALNTQTNLVSNSLSISGLTVSNNYTVDYDAGVVVILNSTASGNYTAVYNYEGTQYLNSSGDRTLAGIIVLAGIIGLLVLILKVFGVM